MEKIKNKYQRTCSNKISNEVEKLLSDIDIENAIYILYNDRLDKTKILEKKDWLWENVKWDSIMRRRCIIEATLMEPGIEDVEYLFSIINRPGMKLDDDETKDEAEDDYHIRIFELYGFFYALCKNKNNIEVKDALDYFEKLVETYRSTEARCFNAELIHMIRLLERMYPNENIEDKTEELIEKLKWTNLNKNKKNG